MQHQQYPVSAVNPCNHDNQCILQLQWHALLSMCVCMCVCTVLIFMICIHPFGTSSKFLMAFLVYVEKSMRTSEYSQQQWVCMYAVYVMSSCDVWSLRQFLFEVTLNAVTHVFNHLHSSRFQYSRLFLHCYNSACVCVCVCVCVCEIQNLIMIGIIRSILSVELLEF